MMTAQELAEKILSMSKEAQERANTLTETYAVDTLCALMDDIEQLCREQLEDSQDSQGKKARTW